MKLSALLGVIKNDPKCITINGIPGDKFSENANMLKVKAIESLDGSFDISVIPVSDEELKQEEEEWAALMHM